MIYVLTVVLFADVITALNMPSSKTEIGPAAKYLIDNPLIAIAIKTALILFVVSLCISIREKHPKISNVVCLTGIVVGIVGTMSNL